MKKVKFVILFFSVLIMNLNNSFAAEKLYDSCKIHSSQATLSRFRIEIGNVEKYGFIYDMKLGDTQAFCLDAGKSNETTYTKGDKINPHYGKGTYFYSIYNWYLDHPNNPQALTYAQLAIWIVEDGSLMKNGRNVDPTDDITKAVMQGKLTSQCSNNESIIRQLAHNDYFSCKCFLRKEGSSSFLNAGCGNAKYDYIHPVTKVTQKYASNSRLTNGKLTDAYGYWGGSKAQDLTVITVADYMDWYFTGSFLDSDKGGNSYAQTVMYNAEAGIVADIISEMLNYPAYSGDLYYWNPSGGTGEYQRLIGIAGCDEGDRVSGCPEDLAELLDKVEYNTETKRKNSANYMSELQKLKDEYPNRLNIEDPYNPTCTPPDTTIEPVCDPVYKEYVCSFTNNNGGFLITDTGSETDNACWLGRGVSYNYGSDKVSSDTNLGNKYCPVRCYEAFGADFPGAVDNIKAGTFFFWGRGSSSDGYLGNLNATRYCQTVGIDYGTFRNDFNANEGDIQTAYDSYVAQKKYNAKSGYDSTEKCTLNATCEQTGTKSAGCSGHYWEYGGKCITMDAGDPSCSKPSNQGGHPGGSPLGPACITGEKSLDTKTVCNKCPTGYNDDDENGTCEKDGTEYKRNSVNYNGQQSTSKSKCMESNSSASDIDAALDDATELSSRATTLQGLIDKREGLTHLIRSCQSQEFINKNNTDLYTFKGEVKLNYTDPAGINRNIDGATLNRVDDVSVSDSGVLKSTTPESFTCRDTSEYTGAANYSGCFGDSTTPSQTFTLTSYSSYSWKYTGLFKYYYPVNEYSWKAIVENAHVVNEKTYTADYSGMKIVPYKVGYGIPTAFSLITGFYNIGVDISGFGHNGHFDKVMQKEENVSVYNYACPYKVVNELYGTECNWDCNYGTRTCTLIAGSPEYCKREVKGIDLVYRLIEMPNNVNLETRRKTVFPSIDGDGRAPGANWEKFINEHTTGFTNVTSNNVVYDNNSAINTYGPIYEIELTPSAISQIREDTLSYRNTDKDPYTSYTDANNHEKVICKGDHTERTCASNYITELIQSNIITGGYYLKCNSCRNNTNERLDWIDSQKERFY